mgnify:CR=1 FL=1
MHCQIIRNELLKLLDKGLDYPLALIVAAPGFGKSILLSQWQETLSDRCVVRLDITAKYDGRVVFQRIIDSLKNITPMWEASSFNLFKSELPLIPEGLIDVLIRAFEQVEQPMVIVLDDFHHLQCEKTHDAFSELIFRLPRHVNIVIASRMHPMFPLSRFKLEERVFVVDGNDLKLKESELIELGEQITGSVLGLNDAGKLLKQTEGWFVGVKIALLAFERIGQTALDSFDGRQPELLNYFGYEVLKNLTNDVRKFVLSTVLFERFDKALCEHVLDVKSSALILEKVAAQELFLMPVSGRPGYYRYHPLLQEFLRNRLELEEGRAYINGLHRKSAEYFLQNRCLSSALLHASKCEDLDYYYSILSTVSHHWIKQGQFDMAIESVVELSDAELEVRPLLLIPLIYALTFSRRFNQAEYYLDVLKSTLTLKNLESKGASGQANKGEFWVVAHFLERLLQLFRLDMGTLKEVDMNVFSVTHLNFDMRALSMIILAYVKLNQGDFSQAFKMANDAKTLFSKIGHRFLASYADLIIILCDRYFGRGVDAIQNMNMVYTEIDTGEKTPVWVNLATGMMVTYYEQNALDQAIELSEELLPLVNFACVTEVVSTVYLYYSRLQSIKGNKQKSGKLLDQLERILLLGNYERFHSQIAQEKMRQALMNNASEVADQLYQKYGLSDLMVDGVWVKHGHYHESRERYALAAVYYVVSKERYEEAYVILAELIAVLEGSEVKMRALIARCNLVSINFIEGNKSMAVSQLKRIIERYGLVCFSRSVFDESPGLDKVFQYAVNLKRIELPVIFTEIFTDLLQSTGRESESIKPEKILTSKELEIFELLAAGLTNADISKQSDIALSTTKWHLKNIYTKLGVANRSGAMMIAHKS